MEQSVPEPQPERDLPGLEVLTLPEAAAFLRTSEEVVVELVKEKFFPAQRVGGEWRFLKQALIEFLYFGPYPSREFRMFYSFWEEKFSKLEQLILSNLSSLKEPSAKPGSKQAVLMHFGVFKENADLREQLTNIRKWRESTGE